MKKEEKLTITRNDLSTIEICVELLGTSKDMILDIRTIDALITPSDILILIQDLHSSAHDLKDVFKKLKLISGEEEN